MLQKNLIQMKEYYLVYKIKILMNALNNQHKNKNFFKWILK